MIEEEEITKRQALDYEVSSSLWASFIGITCLQDMASTYFAWKVKRKHQRYRRARYISRQISLYGSDRIFKIMREYDKRDSK